MKKELTERGKTILKNREELVERVIDEIQSNMYEYKDFVLDLCRDTLSKWKTSELRDFLNPNS